MPQSVRQLHEAQDRGTMWLFRPTEYYLMTVLFTNENLFERKLSTVNFNGANNNNNNEELTAEMANLEGIMKDLNAITAQQFEC